MLRVTSYTMPGWAFGLFEMEDGSYAVKGGRVSAGKAPTDVVTISSGHATTAEATTALVAWLAIGGKRGVGSR